MCTRKAIGVIGILLLAAGLSACAIKNDSPLPTHGAAFTASSPVPSQVATIGSRPSAQIAEPVVSPVLRETPAGLALSPPTPEPAPLPTKEGTNLHFSAGCPSPQGAEVIQALTREEALDVIRRFYSGSPEQRREMTDPAFWPVLPSEVDPLALVEKNLSEPRSARESPYAELLAQACGEDVLDYLWWVEVCPGSPPPDRPEQCPPALRLHYFLIRRGEQWLIWGSG